MRSVSTHLFGPPRGPFNSKLLIVLLSYSNTRHHTLSLTSTTSANGGYPVFFNIDDRSVPCVVQADWRVRSWLDPADNAVIYCNGKVISPIDTFASAGIHQFTVIHCVPRVRGGATRTITEEELDAMVSISTTEIADQSEDIKAILFMQYPSCSRKDAIRRKKYNIYIICGML